MGRLFWKLFAAFWLCILLAGGAVGLVTWVYQSGSEGKAPGFAREEEQRLRAMESVLRYAGEESARQLLQSDAAGPPRPRVQVVDERGVDLFGKPVRAIRGKGEKAIRAQEVISRSGKSYRVYVEHGAFDGGPRHEAPPLPMSSRPWIPLVLGLIASVTFSALVAWYLAAPVRSLRRAVDDVAQGKLDTRLHAALTTRQDELGDLGRDFDRMAQQLQTLMGAQRRLLHDVSHELRSPLARLQTAIGIIRQNPDRQQDMLDRLELEFSRLDHLVGELLVLSRLQDGTVQLHRSPLELVDLLAGICDDARFEAQARQRNVIFSGDGEINFQGSAELIGRALENIVRNAVKFTRENTAVEVSVRQEGGRAHVDIRDSGPGVPETELPMIFVPFFRGANGVVMNGTGLGLAIASRAIEAHGGTISAANRPQGGLHVHVELPLA